MARKYYPGGFRLTKTQAARLAVQELGTARGLEQLPDRPAGFFGIQLGRLSVTIQPDTFDNSGRIALVVMMGNERIVRLFVRDTLEEDYYEEEVYRRRTEREFAADWVQRNGPKAAQKLIDQYFG